MRKSNPVEINPAVFRHNAPERVYDIIGPQGGIILSDKEEKIQLLHPDPEKEAPRINTWKYELVKTTILNVVPNDEGGSAFKTLFDQVAEQLSPEELENLGSVGWYTTTVKLDLETRGFIERVPGSKQQRLRRL